MFDNSTVGLDSLPEDAVNLLGPSVISFFIQALQTGVVLAQLSTFWVHADSRSITVTALVLWVCSVAMFQTFVYFAKFWTIFVTRFGQETDAGWITCIQPLVTSLMASPIQAFLIWRCCHIFQGNRLVIIPLVVILLASVTFAIMVTQKLFEDDITATAITRYVWAPYVLCLALPALLDIALTGCLLTFLIRSLKHAYARRVRRAIFSLMIICWEVAVPPTVCAIAVLIMYIIWAAHPTPQFWVLGLQSILGKLHVISLFFFLNGRVEMACSDAHGCADIPSPDEHSRSHPHHMSTLTIPAMGNWGSSESSQLAHFVVSGESTITAGAVLSAAVRTLARRLTSNGPISCLSASYCRRLPSKPRHQL